MTFRLFHNQRRLLSSRLSSTTNPLVHHHQQPSSPSTACRYRAAIAMCRSHRRSIVTSSVPPSPDVFIERPEAMVLVESSLYKHSWKDFCESFYPSMGMHFASIDMMKTSHSSSSSSSKGLHTKSSTADALSLKSLEQTLARDLSHLEETADLSDADLFIPGHAPQISSSAYSVLIARGPIQCLVAQYFLESLPLAGLVLIDPLLLPDDGRSGAKKKMKSEETDKTRWKPSLTDLMSMLENKAPSMYDNVDWSSDDEGKDLPPLVLPGTPNETRHGGSSLNAEISLLRSLVKDKRHKRARPLKLESGAVPILICYSGDHTYDDYYRICSERTAAFHTCGGRGDYFDQVSVVKIQKKMGREGPVDDLKRLSMSIYEWYEEMV
eukprot:CAMPEP_0183737996 /NCGR_PEP_ID=MMETSP0737-20130205/53605_1 /TAXON_ID=385413 /ORGANISM="Thalassiosira miniscula, Strain CCMP1093" /LENGTH=380 /DNA_ID=CAMNT_0025972437 /DNA_START=148 /DNA_END=1290 /DNA_ORIENTATION=-